MSPKHDNEDPAPRLLDSVEGPEDLKELGDDEL